MSSIGPSRFSKSFKAAATVSAYRVVTYDTATATPEAYVRVIQVPTETSHLLGISQDYADTTAAQFQAVPVISFGYAKVAAGTSVSAGALLTAVTTTGYVIEATDRTTTTWLTGTFSTQGAAMLKHVGVALQKASLSDAVIECFVNLDQRHLRIS
jgi:hypothetical protein